MNNYQNLALYIAAHPTEGLALSIGMRYAPNLTMDLVGSYSKNFVKFMGANLRDTGKALGRSVRRAPKFKGTKFGTSKLPGYFGLISSLPDINTATFHQTAIL